MSSSRQSKSKTVKTKETTTRRKDQRVLADLGSTLSNSRSINRFNHSHNSRKQIPKILSRIEKNVQDLRQYCSDITPSVPKKRHDHHQHPGQSIRTVNDHAQESISSVDEIKKNYMSYYGKETENIHELWKFYNSFLNKSQGKRTSLTSQSVSIPNRSQNLPDYSLESKENSGRNSGLGLIDKIHAMSGESVSVNFSDLFSNRPSDKRTKNQSLQKAVEQEQCRPVQSSKSKIQARPVKNIQFNLQAELDLIALPSTFSKVQEQNKTPKIQVETAEVSSRQPKKQTQKPIVPTEKFQQHTSEFALFQHALQIKISNAQIPLPLNEIKLTAQQESNIEKQLTHMSGNEIQDKDFFKKIFQKNMLINKRKQELNSKLKNSNKPSENEANNYENGYNQLGLDEAIIVQDKPLLEYELPLSKQDISLLQKLDQLDKQIVPLPKSEAENCVFEALKKLKKKKDFQKSKFGVPEIPIKKFSKQVQIIDVPLEQYNLQQVKLQHFPKKKEKQQKEICNTSLLDCEIEGIEAEDSLLQNLEDISIDL